MKPKRLPWGHKSRHCVYCGRVGPRTRVASGYAHKRCIPVGIYGRFDSKLKRCSECGNHPYDGHRKGCSKALKAATEE